MKVQSIDKVNELLGSNRSITLEEGNNVTFDIVIPDSLRNEKRGGATVAAQAKRRDDGTYVVAIDPSRNFHLSIDASGNVVLRPNTTGEYNFGKGAHELIHVALALLKDDPKKLTGRLREVALALAREEAKEEMGQETMTRLRLSEGDLLARLDIDLGEMGHSEKITIEASMKSFVEGGVAMSLETNDPMLKMAAEMAFHGYPQDQLAANLFDLVAQAELARSVHMARSWVDISHEGDRSDQEDGVLGTLKKIHQQAKDRVKQETDDLRSLRQGLNSTYLWRLYVEEVQRLAEIEGLAVRINQRLSSLSVGSDTAMMDKWSDAAVRDGNQILLDVVLEAKGQVYDGAYSWTAGREASPNLLREYARVKFNTILDRLESMVNDQDMTWAEADYFMRKEMEKAGLGKFGYWQKKHTVSGEEGFHSFLGMHHMSGRKAEGRIRHKDVISVEPGYYLPGIFGVREERTFVVNKTPKAREPEPTPTTPTLGTAASPVDNFPKSSSRDLEFSQPESQSARLYLPIYYHSFDQDDLLYWGDLQDQPLFSGQSSNWSSLSLPKPGQKESLQVGDTVLDLERTQESIVFTSAETEKSLEIALEDLTGSSLNQPIIIPLDLEVEENQADQEESVSSSNLAALEREYQGLLTELVAYNSGNNEVSSSAVAEQKQRLDDLARQLTKQGVDVNKFANGLQEAEPLVINGASNFVGSSPTEPAQYPLRATPLDKAQPVNGPVMPGPSSLPIPTPASSSSPSPASNYWQGLHSFFGAPVRFFFSPALGANNTDGGRQLSSLADRTDKLLAQNASSGAHAGPTGVDRSTPVFGFSGSKAKRTSDNVSQAKSASSSLSRGLEIAALKRTQLSSLSRGKNSSSASRSEQRDGLVASGKTGILKDRVLSSSGSNSVFSHNTYPVSGLERASTKNPLANYQSNAGQAPPMDGDSAFLSPVSSSSSRSLPIYSNTNKTSSNFKGPGFAEGASLTTSLSVTGSLKSSSSTPFRHLPRFVRLPETRTAKIERHFQVIMAAANDQQEKKALEAAKRELSRADYSKLMWKILASIEIVDDQTDSTRTVGSVDNTSVANKGGLLWKPASESSSSITWWSHQTEQLLPQAETAGARLKTTLSAASATSSGRSTRTLSQPMKMSLAGSSTSSRIPRQSRYTESKTSMSVEERVRGRKLASSSIKGIGSGDKIQPVQPVQKVSDRKPRQDTPGSKQSDTEEEEGVEQEAARSGVIVELSKEGLRLLAESQAKEAQEIKDQPSESSSSLKVLVADDEDPLRKLVSMVVTRSYQQQGVELLQAANGQEALDIFAENPDVALVVSDINMPKVDGHNLARTIKESNPRIYIILMTGNPDEEQRAKKEAIADLVLSKPFRISDLMSTFAQARSTIDKQSSSSSAARDTVVSERVRGRTADPIDPLMVMMAVLLGAVLIYSGIYFAFDSLNPAVARATGFGSAHIYAFTSATIFMLGASLALPVILNLSPAFAQSNNQPAVQAVVAASSSSSASARSSNSSQPAGPQAKINWIGQFGFAASIALAVYYAANLNGYSYAYALAAAIFALVVGFAAFPLFPLIGKLAVAAWKKVISWLANIKAKHLAVSVAILVSLIPVLLAARGVIDPVWLVGEIGLISVVLGALLARQANNRKIGISLIIAGLATLTGFAFAAEFITVAHLEALAKALAADDYRLAKGITLGVSALSFAFGEFFRRKDNYNKLGLTLITIGFAGLAAFSFWTGLVTKDIFTAHSYLGTKITTASLSAASIVWGAKRLANEETRDSGVTLITLGSVGLAATGLWTAADLGWLTTLGTMIRDFLAKYGTAIAKIAAIVMPVLIVVAALIAAIIKAGLNWQTVKRYIAIVVKAAVWIAVAAGLFITLGNYKWYWVAVVGFALLVLTVLFVPNEVWQSLGDNIASVLKVAGVLFVAAIVSWVIYSYRLEILEIPLQYWVGGITALVGIAIIVGLTKLWQQAKYLKFWLWTGFLVAAVALGVGITLAAAGIIEWSTLEAAVKITLSMLGVAAAIGLPGYLLWLLAKAIYTNWETFIEKVKAFFSKYGLSLLALAFGLLLANSVWNLVLADSLFNRHLLGAVVFGAGLVGVGVLALRRKYPDKYLKILARAAIATAIVSAIAGNAYLYADKQWLAASLVSVALSAASITYLHNKYGKAFWKALGKYSLYTALVLAVGFVTFGLTYLLMYHLAAVGLWAKRIAVVLSLVLTGVVIYRYREAIKKALSWLKDNYRKFIFWSVIAIAAGLVIAGLTWLFVHYTVETTIPVAAFGTLYFGPQAVAFIIQAASWLWNKVYELGKAIVDGFIRMYRAVRDWLKNNWLKVIIASIVLTAVGIAAWQIKLGWIELGILSAKALVAGLGLYGAYQLYRYNRRGFFMIS
ncbi:MAG: response regulator, partial [Candidatus Omnitrophica bacterium]|nr:response regulator [Candidatus Omnitrophota bacterium]